MYIMYMSLKLKVIYGEYFPDKDFGNSYVLQATMFSISHIVRLCPAYVLCIYVVQIQKVSGL